LKIDQGPFSSIVAVSAGISEIIGTDASDAPDGNYGCLLAAHFIPNNDAYDNFRHDIGYAK
jgi:hypothetical protein